HGHPHGAPVLHGGADVDRHAVRHAAVREVAAAVEHAPVLARRDVGLASLGADQLLLVVGVHGGFAALPARHGRDAAGALRAAHLLLLALDGEGAVGLHVGGLVALNLHAIVALFAGRRVPGAGRAEEAHEHEQADHRLAARA